MINGNGRYKNDSSEQKFEGRQNNRMNRGNRSNFNYQDDRNNRGDGLNIQRNYNKSDDSTHVVSIMLEKISSIEVHYSSWLICLLLGIISAAAGFVLGVNNNGAGMVAGLALGGILILIYFLTRN